MISILHNIHCQIIYKFILNLIFLIANQSSMHVIRQIDIIYNSSICYELCYDTDHIVVSPARFSGGDI